MTTPSAVEIRQAAKLQADLARTWQFNDEYERSLKFRERDPKEWETLPANHRTAVLGYYLPGRDAAKAAGMDISGGAR